LPWTNDLNGTTFIKVVKSNFLKKTKKINPVNPVYPVNPVNPVNPGNPVNPVNPDFRAFPIRRYVH
jgi:hypothetical protein